MKPVKQNILSMIAVALFAILSAIVEGSFVYDYGAELGQVAESEKVFTAHDFADNPLYLSRESTADATLLTFILRNFLDGERHHAFEPRVRLARD